MINNPSNSSTNAQRGTFLVGFCGSVLLSVGWQIVIGIAAVLIGSSQLLAAHTRYQYEIAAGIGLFGMAWNIWGLYHSFRRVRPRVADGIAVGTSLLMLMGIGVIFLGIIGQDLRD